MCLGRGQTHELLPRGPCGLPWGLIAAYLEVSCAFPSRSQGTNFETKIFNFRCFLALLTEASFTTPHYYPKYEVWAIENFFWYDPFKDISFGFHVYVLQMPLNNIKKTYSVYFDCASFWYPQNINNSFWHKNTSWGDPTTNKFLSPKPHILDSNGVWYCLFCSEVSKKS